MIKNKGLQYWLPQYLLKGILKKKTANIEQPTHIMFSVVDHYEPFHGNVDWKTAKQRVDKWVTDYPRMAKAFKDSDNRPPQHTWFYPPHLDHCFLTDLVGLCKYGFGEVEMHLHHNHMEPFPDTHESLRTKIKKCIEDYAVHGIFCLPDGSRRFAFIHGDWSLDNAAGPEICGVNSEISILKELGCFADFTFPAINQCQPRMVNTIYYCKDDPDRPKSYDKGIPVSVGILPEKIDLMMITGPIGLRKNKHRPFVPSIESGSFGYQNPPSCERVDFWIKTNIHVVGRPEWIFVKIHTHGAPEFNHDVNIGRTAEAMYKYISTKYNDGERYLLHFVTAREMYNIIKAAEAGFSGNPNNFRDYLIPRYMYK